MHRAVGEKESLVGYVGSKCNLSSPFFEQAVRSCRLALTEFGVHEHVCDGSELVQS